VLALREFLQAERDGQRVEPSVLSLFEIGVEALKCGLRVVLDQFETRIIVILLQGVFESSDGGLQQAAFALEELGLERVR
jgi:hypothetical protein